MHDVIASISTAVGVGAISIIRVSGIDSIKVVDSIFRGKNSLLDVNSHTINYGYIVDKEEIIDEVLVSIMKAPKTFTTEDVVEINCHGGIATTNKVLELLLLNGARLAEPGEFTKRAFLNGKMDLSQAEAVIDIINSKTQKEIKNSAKQLDGELGDNIREIKKAIIDILVDLEANIDYPEYDIEEITKNKVYNGVSDAIDKLSRLSNSYEQGKVIKSGINIAIVGKPNVGKSSLLNRLLKEERAIVTDIAGTTRDTIEESIIHEGVLLNFIDTAGIHETTDIVESIGVEKSKKALEDANLILFIIDNSKEIDKEDFDLLDSIKDKKKIVLVNKIDINEKIDKRLVEYTKNTEILSISAKNNIGINELLDKIIEDYKLNKIENNDEFIITNQRHKEAIDKTIVSFKNILTSLLKDVPLDMISIDLQNGLEYLGEILGENINEDIINGIFAKFCLGK